MDMLRKFYVKVFNFETFPYRVSTHKQDLLVKV